MRFLLFIFMLQLLSHAQVKPAAPLRGIKSDDKVVYVEDLSTDTIKLKVKKETPIFLNKNGKRRIGTLKLDSLCELIGFDHRAIKIKGEAKHSTLTGWVSPFSLESKDPDMAANFKKFYEREMAMKEFIEKEEVAVGMTPLEVIRVLGEPTRKPSVDLSSGISGRYEFSTYKNVELSSSGYTDPITGIQSPPSSTIMKQESGCVTVEFKKGIVSTCRFQKGIASTSKRDEDRSALFRNPRTITGPLFLDWIRNELGSDSGKGQSKY